MLPKSRRLSLSRDFERIFAQGKAGYGRFFKIRQAPNNLKFSRFAVVVSNKVSKRAVVRNRIRRRAWSVLSDIHLLVGSGHDFVLVAQALAAEAGFSEIVSEITQLLVKRPKR